MRDGAHVARAALMMLAMQVEAGHGCPLSMTFSALNYPITRVGSLRARPTAVRSRRAASMWRKLRAFFMSGDNV